MRILWMSRAPWAAGGYSNQTALFAPRLAASGNEVAIVAVEGIFSGMLDWQGIPIYPLLPNDFRNSTTVGLHYQHWNAELMVSLHDPDQVIDGPALVKRFPGLRWALWFPIDTDRLSPKILSRLRWIPTPVAISRFGERVAREHGVPIRYVPHGVDTQAFRPMGQREARARIGWPPGHFVAGMIAANDGTRKAFPQNIEGFARFHRRHPDSMLYLHTEEVAPRGLDLSSICTEAGLKVGSDVVFCDLYRYFIGIPTSEMAALYSAMDVLLMVTKGEGFGIPIVEAQACGTSVIVGDWSAMPELCFAGWKVRREESTGLENGWRQASPEAIADRL
ncbi:MAG TPA: glycosyltransferase family 4 protein, partial [Thermoanaerobaculia bacterium]|nr:glycosyltransferase family 4 protein [Thermoanaerobaculia bacterium]